MQRLAGSALLVCLLSISSGVSAQNEPPTTDAWPDAAPPERLPEPALMQDHAPEAKSGVREHWYGWQTLTVDAGALLLGVVSAEFGEPGIALLAASTYVLGGPIVHFAHENGLRGLASLGLRVAMPIVFAIVGAAAEACSTGRELCGLGGAVIGGSLGIVGAVAVDAAALAWEEVPNEQSALPRLRLALDRNGAGLIASGAF